MVLTLWYYQATQKMSGADNTRFHATKKNNHKIISWQWLPRDNTCMYMAHACFYSCCSDCVGVCMIVCCVAVVVKVKIVGF